MKTVDIQKCYLPEMSIASVGENKNETWIRIYVRSQTCQCPVCGTVSRHRHGTYNRRVQDLPILGKTTILLVNAYEYQCDNPECKVKTFVENCKGFFNYCSRMTKRCEDLVCSLALETSCEGCARICKVMGINISGDTVIRILTKRYIIQPEKQCGSVVGIDDFALKKGQNYGTVVVDGQTHETVAVLEGRDGVTLREWLKRNPHIKTVTRDRASAYASAIQDILPDAIQIADRFHLHQNLFDAVKNTVTAIIPVDIRIPIKENETNETKKVPNLDKKTINAEKHLCEYNEQHIQIYHAIHKYRDAGCSYRQIATILHCSHHTITKYLNGDYEALCRRDFRSGMDYYYDYIIQELTSGVSRKDVYRALVQKGYQGKQTAAYDYMNKIIQRFHIDIAKYRSLTAEAIQKRKTLRKYEHESRQSIFRFLWMGSELKGHHKEYILKKYPQLQELGHCIQEFRDIYKKRCLPQLYSFIEQYEKSQLPEIAKFAGGLKKDLEAVKNSVTSPLSNGFVEGTVNKIKMVKRTMFGRASRLLLSAKLMLVS